jgi:hypothetical protein
MAFVRSKDVVMSQKDVRGPRPEDSGRGKGVIGVQLIAYSMLLLSGLAVSLWPISAVILCWIIVVGAAMLGALLFWWPFDDTVTTSLVERGVSGVTGLCAFVASAVVVPRLVMEVDAGSESRASLTSWAVVFGTLVTVLVIIAFITQMLRRVRSHLIRSLSHAVFGGIACVSAAGWSFLPLLIGIAKSAGGVKHVVGFVLVVLVVLVILLSLGAAASSWWNEDTAKEAYVRVGIGLLPVMVGGIAVYMATLATYFLVF